ncbi:MAG TPA: MFS transporter [Candidatus Saccharimonadales bacterium]|nr:MFS transporter [Candidatus Saccharimonadales bacterium]
MQGPQGPNQFSSDETADAVLAAGQAASGEALPAVGPNGSDTRAVIAVSLAGIAAFFNLYATQPLLPLLEQIFHASKSQVGRTVSAATLGVAISAPLCGALAERVGRRKVIVISIFLLALPTIMAATAGSLSVLVFWRFLQGVVMPGIFGVTIAYIGEEWPRHRVPQVISIYVSGTVLGGFLGRIFTGVAATHHLIPFIEPSWRNGFAFIGAFDIVFGFLLWRWLPRDSPQPLGSIERTSFTSHLRNPQLLATYAVGFNVLFTLVGTFTYITFYLAAPPFGLSPAELSALFMVYLVGLVITPLGGVWISRVGSRAALIFSVMAGIVGVLLTLIPHLLVILLGLVLCSSGVFICQSASTSYIQREAQSGGRASAAGLYVMFYYIGGSFAGVLPGMLWRYGQWKACVALIVLVQLITVAIAGTIWKGKEA